MKENGIDQQTIREQAEAEAGAETEAGELEETEEE